MNTPSTIPILVAHRGYPERYPENTLPGLEAALRLGARAVEFDVQLTADRVPVLLHDEDLQRVTGASGSILETPRSRLRHLSACEPARFGRRYAGTGVATLERAVDLLASHTGVDVFVEIKHHSLQRFGMRYTVQRVLKEIEPIRERCIATSFSDHALAWCRRVGGLRLAWGMRDYGARSRAIAEALEPEFLVCAFDKLPDNDAALWRGEWQWMLYTTNNPTCARKWHRRGANYIETDNIGAMINDFKS